MTFDSIIGARRVRAGVYGATGTTGVELVSLLARHHFAEIGFATSREMAGRTTRAADPAAPDVTLTDPDDADPGEVDVVFTCLPHGRSARWVEHCHRQGARVIDLSGDLRLRGADLHASVYGSARSERVAARAVYGLTELGRPRIAEAEIVSNPGCYPTCVGLALAPAAAAGLISKPVIVHAQSGVSGAGRTPTATTHFCAVTNDVRPYKLGRDHRHLPEIEQLLGDCAPPESPRPQVIFCPHVIPIERGMLATIVLETTGLSASELHELYEAAYGAEPFVEVAAPGEAARIRAVAGTNRATIGVHAVTGSDHVIITCAIDNLLKGAGGQAVQNMNVMFGLPETTGLGPTFVDPVVSRAALEAIA